MASYGLWNREGHLSRPPPSTFPRPHRPPPPVTLPQHFSRMEAIPSGDFNREAAVAERAGEDDERPDLIAMQDAHVAMRWIRTTTRKLPVLQICKRLVSAHAQQRGLRLAASSDVLWGLTKDRLRTATAEEHDFLQTLSDMGAFFARSNALDKRAHNRIGVPAVLEERIGPSAA